MPRMLDVSDEVRAEIGDEEADRLLAGETAPGSYDCTSCRTPGDSEQERTSTVLFIGDETAVLAFAHAGCLPSQVVRVAEEQLRGAVKYQPATPSSWRPDTEVPEQAVLGVTSGLVLIAGELHPALVVEPTAPIARPGTTGSGDDFLPLLIEQGFMPLTELSAVPPCCTAGPCCSPWAGCTRCSSRGATAASRSPGGRRTSRSRSPRAGARPPTSTSRC
ncbi:hypothetical protein SVIOM74S_05872 [Streptomyces violarus]